MIVRLKEIRTSKKLTQEQLSQLSYVGRSTISNIENSIFVPGVDIALLLARALDCTVEDIFKLEGDRQ